jgi:predicted esterase
VLAALVLVAAPQAVPSAQELPSLAKGKVIPRVVCLADSQQSFALYVPSAYDSARKWPVLFAFDPSARGSTPVERFREAAEKYGYLVLGSNNSRNGPIQVQLEATRAMWNDAKRRFAIDEARVYATGFSGGARAACQMGLMLKTMAGVIVAGGGFPFGANPTADVSFALYGIAGEADVNFNEMLRLHRDFTALRIANHFEVLAGGHQWPSSEVCREAIEWMELQAMRGNRRECDPALLASLLNGRLSKMRANQERGKLAAAFHRYAEAMRDFQGLADLKVVEDGVARLKGSPELAKALKHSEKRAKRLEEQDDLQALKFASLLNRILAAGDSNVTDSGTVAGNGVPSTSSSSRVHPSRTTPDAVGGETDSTALEKLIAELGISSLKKTLEKKPGTDAAILAERQRDRIFISTLESARTLIEEKKYRQAVMCLEVTTQVVPDSPFALFNLARALALEGKKRRALKLLVSAAEKGFDRPEMVEQDAAFGFLRDDPRFSAALERIRAHAAPE